MPLVAIFKRIRNRVGSLTIEEAARNKYECAQVVSSACQTHIYSTSGVLSNANNTIFTGPVHMYDINQFDHPAIQRLAEKARPEAIHDSSFRQYVVLCSENTRVSIRKDIVAWRRNPNRQSRLRWYMGSAAVGKSAIAQSVAMELEETGHLGATFFFSRPGNIDDPDSVVPTLAYQLATRNDLYKATITKLLANDPFILTKSRSVQFKRLIIEPFQVLMTSHNFTNDDPLTIILDGLDECKCCETQCDGNPSYAS
ncbi:hypothetical protein NP233_g3325 [Leucocoprinus birnbaumii]|uniref:Nephrocystin 3-like N-terminal domain-containing protein n=1 Tax=Leucocoprinus birnbaumii TaxID=56174 RepID=A0AAD5VWS9_9AGAR|nr:hypothetical protein NP233_g3325 [Leucocoprinus birnbaumii]